MNIFTIISFLIAVAVLIGGFYLASPDLRLFLDFSSAFIVIGGTFAATSISFGLNRIFFLTKLYFIRVIKGKGADFPATVIELIKSIDELKKGKKIKDISGGVKDYFFKESLDLIDDGLLSQEEVVEILELRNVKLTTIYKKDCDKMRAIGKFPPAFGMIGTTIGMIVLLANLGGEDAMKMIGPAMGVCLITTLYGSAIANIFIIPMAENLTENTKETYSKNEIIIEGTRLILANANPILAAERLNSFLSPGERVDWKTIIK